jgi:hypothetical protein
MTQEEMLAEINRLETLVAKLTTLIASAAPAKIAGLFVCGSGGETDNMGLPDFIMVCPTFGLDGMCIYKKHGEYSAPGW